MTARPAFDAPSETTAIDGEVVMVGPASVGFSFTPDAARETSRRLAEAAGKADAQYASEDGSADGTPMGT